MKKTLRAKTPDWARDAIWYQIFPERFRNGAPQSNPRLSDVAEHPVAEWSICPWGDDWYKPQPWEDGHPGKHGGVYLRRYGGDLPGIREKLDYIEDLGVTALYLNPIFAARSLHKYDGASFHHIDPTFGPDRAGDLRALAKANETEDPESWIWTEADRYFLELIQEVHSRGLRIIIDGVFNHTGREFFAFQDILKHGRKSRYVDWYIIEKWHKDGTFDYKSWFNHKALPEFNRTSDNLIPPIHKYIFDITKRWMDPAGDGDTRKGIDGWRLDVAFCVPHGFWRDWRKCVKSINPEAYLTAEIVQLAKEYLRGDEFDAVMNYMWMYPVVEYFQPARKPLSTSAFKRRLDHLRDVYPKEVTPVLQNLLDSHDVARIASMLENPDEPKSHWEDYFHVSRVKQNPRFKTTKPGEKAYQVLKQLTIFQMTYTGAPMLYYGAEVGMWGANDPDNRQPMLWDDIVYEAESHSPTGPIQPPTARQPDHELFAFFQKAIRLRKDHPAFSRGRFEWINTGLPRVLGFKRTHEGRTYTVWLNTRDTPVSVRIRKPGRDNWDNNRAVPAGQLEVPPRGWRIIQS